MSLSDRERAEGFRRSLTVVFIACPDGCSRPATPTMGGIPSIRSRGDTMGSTATHSDGWKPSTRSRPLSGISTLEHPHRAALARIVARSGDSAPGGRREPVSPFQSARDRDRPAQHRPAPQTASHLPSFLRYSLRYARCDARPPSEQAL